MVQIGEEFATLWMPEHIEVGLKWRHYLGHDKTRIS